MSYTIDWLVKKYMSFFTEYGITEQNIREQYEVWKNKSNRDDAKHYLWFVFQQMVILIPTQTEQDSPRQHRLLRDVYFKMGEFMVTIEKKNGNHVKHLMLYHEIKGNDYQSTIELKIRIISGHCCPFCDALDKRELTFEEVLNDQPLASNKCTRQYGCNCTYAYFPQRDAAGNVIGKKN